MSFLGAMKLAAACWHRPSTMRFFIERVAFVACFLHADGVA